MPVIRAKQRSPARLAELREHRLEIFEAAFDDYRAGRCPAEYVKYRATLMLKVGLPVKIKNRRKL